SQLATGPQPALALAADLVEQRPDEQQVVYVFSDFREDPWSNPTRLEEPLQRLKDQGVTVNLVRCVDEQRPNLAITRLEPSPGTLAAGVPLFVDVEVKNFGREPAEHVLVDFHTVFHDDELTESPSSPSLSREELPKLDIDRIAPGESVVRRVQVYFPKAGQHAVAAELPADPVAADNRRWCVIQLPAAVPVLVIDGDTQQRNAEFLVSAFRPGRTVETGIRPDVQPESFLRDSTDETLNAYRSIFLLDVGRLDDLAVSNLRRYVESGGGVSFFLGPHSSIEFLRELHDDGKGLFPQPIDRMDLLQPNTTDSPDLQVESHPLFEVLAGEQNAYLRSILVRQYFRTRRDWIPPADSTVNILARLRNGQPLVVERHWGEGRVMALSTTLAPDWNNWATQPTFVVFMLELQAYLQRPNDASTLRLVGNPIELQLDAANVTPEVICSLPALSGLDDGPRREVRKTLQDVSSAEAALTKVTLGEARSAVGEDTNLAGIYEFWTRTVEGNLHVDRYALNVDTRESDLALVAAPALADRLPEDQVAIFAANEGSFGTSDDDRYSWSHFLMYAVAAMLVGEQLLAYSASYHAGAKGGRS
ncbi:MAG: hypothetical protein KDA60_01020, partial [Planctomycetales bacterium]|nr:hypothetical protein [Planctomycetales bacterium]